MRCLNKMIFQMGFRSRVMGMGKQIILTISESLEKTKVCADSIFYIKPVGVFHNNERRKEFIRKRKPKSNIKND